MPNWVYNSIKGWSKELHDKYKSEYGDIDFDKVIPMPKEIKESVSCGFNEPAKRISEYKEFKDKNIGNYTDKEVADRILKCSSQNPIRDDVEKLDHRTAIDIGHLCIANPDETLNNLLDKEENSFTKHEYDKYTSVFGKSSFDTCKNAEKMFSNYINLTDKRFKKFQSNKNNTNISSIQEYKSIEEYGDHLRKVAEKYGYDNWYDWSCANWGTKWNACEANYDEKNEEINFDTAWSIPYPILAKVAEQNPDANLDGYSEEEQGWFDEYTIKDKKVTINARGDVEWDDETDELITVKEDLKPKQVIYFDNDILKTKEE